MLNSKESILDSVKLALGIIPEYSHFDDQIKMQLNSVFSTLYQIGVGPEEGFVVEDDIPVWKDYIKDNKLLNIVKTYVYMRVKLGFDPPTSSFALQALKDQIAEQEWRINVMVDPKVLGEKENG